MALKAVLDTLDDAPETLRDHYRAGTKEEGAEGKFVLGVEGIGGFALENVEGLKSALNKERGSVKSLTALAEKFKDVDLDSLTAAQAELEELKKLDPKSEADKLAQARLEAETKKLTTKYGGEITARDQKINALNGQVDKLARRQEAVAAIAEAKGEVALLLPHVMGQTRTEITDDGVKVVVLDADGNERANSKGEAMTIAELIAEMRSQDTYARAFDGDQQSGTGKKQDSPGGSSKANLNGTRDERASHYAKKFNLPAR